MVQIRRWAAASGCRRMTWPEAGRCLDPAPASRPAQTCLAGSRSPPSAATWTQVNNIYRDKYCNQWCVYQGVVLLRGGGRGAGGVGRARGHRHRAQRGQRGGGRGEQRPGQVVAPAPGRRDGRRGVARPRPVHRARHREVGRRPRVAGVAAWNNKHYVRLLISEKLIGYFLIDTNIFWIHINTFFITWLHLKDCYWTSNIKCTRGGVAVVPRPLPVSPVTATPTTTPGPRSMPSKTPDTPHL